MAKVTKDLPVTPVVPVVDVPERPSQLVPVQPPRNGQIVPQYGDPPDRWPTNLDLTTVRGRAIALNATNPPKLSVPDRGELRMKLRYWIHRICDAVDRTTQEVKQAPSTSLIDVSGDHCILRSAYAYEKMQNLMAIIPPAQWDVGVPILIREHHSVHTQNDSTVIDLDLTADGWL